MARGKTEPKLDIGIFHKASGCPVSKVSLADPEHQALLAEAVATHTISSSAIADVLLERWGVSISKDTISKHRSIPQRCSCRNIPR